MLNKVALILWADGATDRKATRGLVWVQLRHRDFSNRTSKSLSCLAKSCLTSSTTSTTSKRIFLTRSKNFKTPPQQTFTINNQQKATINWDQLTTNWSQARVRCQKCLTKTSKVNRRKWASASSNATPRKVIWPLGSQSRGLASPKYHLRNR